MKRSTRSMRRFGRGLRRIASVSLKVFGVGLAAATAAVIKLGLDFNRFNRAMQSSQAIMGDLAALMKGRMRDAAIDVAKTTKFSAKEAAESFFFLASAGLDAEQSVAALPQVARFAQAGMFDMALATDLLTDAQSALGLTVKNVADNMRNMQRVSDVLVKANTLANASVQQFSEALTTKAGAALKIVNKDIEEGVAVLSAFADQGVKASEAGTALNIVMRDLQTKALKNAEAFAAAGVTVFDSSGKMANMADIVGDLERALDGMSDAQKKATLLQLGFSDKSVIFTQTLLGTSEKIRMYEASLRAAGNTTADVASKQLTPFDKAMALLKGTLSDLGTRLAPAMRILSVMITRFADWINSIITAEGFAERFARGTVKAFELIVRSVAFAARAYEALKATILTISIPVLDVLDAIATAMRNIVGLVPSFLRSFVGLKNLPTGLSQSITALRSARSSLASERNASFGTLINDTSTKGIFGGGRSVIQEASGVDFTPGSGGIKSEQNRDAVVNALADIMGRVADSNERIAMNTEPV